jgi:hypothetical protein
MGERVPGPDEFVTGAFVRWPACLPHLETPGLDGVVPSYSSWWVRVLTLTPPRRAEGLSAPEACFLRGTTHHCFIRRGRQRRRLTKRSCMRPGNWRLKPASRYTTTGTASALGYDPPAAHSALPVTRRSRHSLLKIPAGLLTYRMLLPYGCIRGVSVPFELYTAVHTATRCELVTR